MERAENLARLIAVTESLSAGNDDTGSWTSLLQTFFDEPAYAATGKSKTGLSISRWYLLDRDTPNSVYSTLTLARENARALRHVLPTEMWRQINMLHAHVAGLTARKVGFFIPRYCKDIAYVLDSGTGKRLYVLADA